MASLSFPYVPDHEWLHERTDDNAARFVLGTPGDNPLVCIGINPSTALPNALDRTVSRVSRAAFEHGYDSFVMLNVYPQRSTDPRGLHLEPEVGLQLANERHVADFVRGRRLTVWAGWGTEIGRRPYLAPSLARLLGLPALERCDWVSRGALTNHRHPRHPLYVSNATPFEPFDVRDYARMLAA